MIPLPGQPAARRPSRLWVPALLSSLMLLIVVSGIAVAHFYWTEVRTSMVQMDLGLTTARERQREVIERMSAAQSSLLAQQRHIQETEERLRAREAALTAQREALEEERRRLRLVAERRQTQAAEARIRELVRHLDTTIAGLSDPGGIEAASESVAAIADWTTDAESTLEPKLVETARARLAETMDALAAAESTSTDRLLQRLQRLGQTIARLERDTDTGDLSPWSRRTATLRLGEQIETAAFALERDDETLFRLALDTAAAWLAAFYDPQRAEITALQREIAALRRIPIERDSAPIRQALARLRAALGELLIRAGGSERGESG